MKMMRYFFVSFSFYMNSLLQAIAITGCHSPFEENLKGISPDQPLGGPKVPLLIDFDAKMVNITDLDYSTNVNSGMRQVLCFYLYI